MSPSMHHSLGLTLYALLAAAGVRPRTVSAQQGTPAVLGQAHGTGASDSTGRAVTALGIGRDGRSVGAAQQTVTGDALAAAGATTIVAALAGKVAGADITGTGASGSSVRLLLRGGRTSTGNDQPLFVVNGVPVDNASVSGPTAGVADYGTMIADIDPNDVASITVLNGPNAAALYGARGRNGVILITTRTAQRGTGFAVAARQDFTFESPLRLPDLQNRYGQGDGGVYVYGGAGSIDWSWGPPMDGRPIVQWWSDGQPAPFVAQPNNLRDFFDLGHTSTTNAVVSAAGSASDVRLSVTNLSQDGVQPNSGLRRINASLGGGLSLGSRLTTRLTLQYAHTDASNEPVSGLDPANPMVSFLFAGRQLDLSHLRNYALIDGQQAFPTPQFENNPYWDVYADQNADLRDRAIGVLSAAYDLAPWLTASVRTGMDWSHDRWVQRYAYGSVGILEGGAESRDAIRSYQENNTDVLVSAQHALSRAFATSLDLGYSRRSGHVNGPDGCTYGDNTFPFQCAGSRTKVRTNSAYGRVGFSMDSTLFLDVTGRNDWELAGTSAARATFSPSVSSAFVFRDAARTPGASGWLSYGKLRASWSQLGGVGDAPGLPMLSWRILSWEEGLDLGSFGNRMSISATHYDERLLGQTLIATQTGFRAIPMATADRGMEVQLGAVPIRRKEFGWDVSVRYAQNSSRLDPRQGNGYTATLDSRYRLVGLVAGDAYGQLFAATPRRDAQGRLVVNGGLPELGDVAAVGSELPDWTGGLENHLCYKRFDVNVLVDVRHGGRFYSETTAWGSLNGVLASTLRGREHGEAIQDGGGMVVPGVNEDGTPNTTVVTAQEYFQSMGYLLDVYDASAITLREVRIGYTPSPAVLRRLRVSALTLSAVGRNLWLDARAPNVDPGTAFDVGAAQGGEFLSAPSVRSYGLTLQVTP